MQNSRRPIVGMLNNNVVHGAGGLGIGAYLDRVQSAKKAGVELVNVTLSQDNATLLAREGRLRCRVWTGRLFEERVIPLRDVKAVYHYAIQSIGNANGLEEIRSAAKQAGIPFVNTNNLGGDKWTSHQILTEAGVPTPRTCEFTYEGFTSLLADHGFVFIKPKGGFGGKGQVTVRKEGSEYLVKFDGKEQKVASLDEAYALCSRNASEKVLFSRRYLWI